ncbi:MAG: hypothetical protein ACYYKD_05125 [Rhodospirillales bacterium]
MEPEPGGRRKRAQGVTGGVPGGVTKPGGAGMMPGMTANMTANMKRFFALTAAVMTAACAAPPPAARAPVILNAPAQVDWKAEFLERFAPLSCARGTRWPLILWHAPEFDSVQDVRALLARGIVPHIRLDAAMTDAAKTIQSAGAPVMMMEGKSGAWGYGGDTPSPMHIKGWRGAADSIRKTMRAFRDAGVTVNAVWMDYEVDPLNLRYEHVLRTPEAREDIPPGALKSPAAFSAWRRRLWTGLMSAYAAGPVREVFPAASVTNWMTVLSTPEHPAPGMIAGAVPPAGTGLFTTTNPVAYGSDAGFWAQGGAPGMDRDEADRIYTALVLGQFSADAANRRALAPHLSAAPWVGRWVVISQQPEAHAGGAGVRVSEHPRGLLIEAVDPAGPSGDGAAGAGLRKGDIITGVITGVITGAGVETLAGIELNAAVNLVRGAPDSALGLRIARGDETFDAEIMRARLDGGRPPVMSRERYREALRHIWLRGADAMQVFNSATPGHADMAVAEAEDAQAVYAEMLAHKKFLDGGAPLNLETPRPGDRIIWSGLRLKNEAIVRVTGIGARRNEITVSPWPGTSVTLPVPGANGADGADEDESVTWILRKNPDTGRTTAAPAETNCQGGG